MHTQTERGRGEADESQCSQYVWRNDEGAMVVGYKVISETGVCHFEFAGGGDSLLQVSTCRLADRMHSAKNGKEELRAQFNFSRRLSPKMHLGSGRSGSILSWFCSSNTVCWEYLTTYADAIGSLGQSIRFYHHCLAKCFLQDRSTSLTTTWVPAPIRPDSM